MKPMLEVSMFVQGVEVKNFILSSGYFTPYHILYPLSIFLFLSV